jgi:hypothetical protein
MIRPNKKLRLSGAVIKNNSFNSLTRKTCLPSWRVVNAHVEANNVSWRQMLVPGIQKVRIFWLKILT